VFYCPDLIRVDERAGMAKCDITVRGNLGADVEVKWSKAGKAYSVLRVGSTPSKKNASGEWENGDTMWFSVTVFEELNPFEFKKGAPVEIEGTFTHRVFTKKDGSQGYSLDVLGQHIQLAYKEGKKAQVPETIIPTNWQPISDDAPF